MRLKFIILSLIFIGLSANISFGQSFCPLVEQKAKPRPLSSIDSFKSIATLHEGRVKPLDTYARI